MSIAVATYGHAKNEDHELAKASTRIFGSRRRGSRDAEIHDGEVTENPALGVPSSFGSGALGDLTDAAASASASFVEIAITNG